MPSTPKTIIAYGEILWDLLPDGPVLGGAPCNFAYRVNALGNRSVMISRLGRDDFGDRAEKFLTDAGMATAHLQRDEKLPTGTVEVTLDAARNPDYYIVPGVAYDAIESTDQLRGLAAGADAFCFGTLVQRAPKSRATLYELLEASPRSLKFFDINLRKNCYSTGTIADSLARADVLKLNESESGYLAEQYGLPSDNLVEFLRRVLERWSLSHGVITLGDKGALAMAGAVDRPVYTPGGKVEVADPCGSGDAFSAGFVHGLLQEWPLAECCGLGNAMGGLVATQNGATEPISWDDITAFRKVSREPILDARFTDFLAEG